MAVGIKDKTEWRQKPGEGSRLSTDPRQIQSLVPTGSTNGLVVPFKYFQPHGVHIWAFPSTQIPSWAEINWTIFKCVLLHTGVAVCLVSETPSEDHLEAEYKRAALHRRCLPGTWGICKRTDLRLQNAASDTTRKTSLVPIL